MDDEARARLDALLTAYEPYPASIVDGRWDVLSANYPLQRLMDTAAADLLQPPVNVLRLLLCSRGIAPRIANIDQVRQHIRTFVRRCTELTGDTAILAELDRELRNAGWVADPTNAVEEAVANLIPIDLWADGWLLKFTSSATFLQAGSWPTSLVMLSFLPADNATRQRLSRW
jgi:hypothetical protein